MGRLLIVNIVLGCLSLVMPTVLNVSSIRIVYAQNATAVSQTATTAAVLLNVYRAATYNLDYPSDWKIVPRGVTETFFGTTTAPTCGQPGLLVTLLGTTNAKTADILLDDYTANNTYLTPVGDRDDANDLGRFQVFRGPCTDGSIRQLRVAMFVAFGSGYRVTAYAPKAAYPQWDSAFQAIDRSFNVTADETSAGPVLQPVYAPDHAPDTLLVHVFNGNIFMANVADVPGTPLTRDGSSVVGTVYYANPRISPDGKRIAFVQMPTSKLYIAPIAKDAVAVATGIIVNSSFPLAWRLDSTEIAYVKAEDTPTIITLQAIHPGDNTVRNLGVVPTANCAAGPVDDPAIVTMRRDLNAVNANGQTFMLEWPAVNQLLVNNSCTGIVALDIPSGQPKPIIALANSLNSVLSPDQSTVAAVIDNSTSGGGSNNNVMLLTLADQQTRTLPIKADRIAWSGDNHSLFYMTRTLNVAPTPNSMATITGTPLPMSTTVPNATRYNLVLHQYNLISGQDVIIYSGQGFMISTIAPSPNGNGVLFTIIPDDATLSQVLPNNVNHTSNGLAQVYWLPLPYQGGQPPILLMDSLQVTFGPPGSTAIIGVPVTPHTGATNIPGG